MTVTDEVTNDARSQSWKGALSEYKHQPIKEENSEEEEQKKEVFIQKYSNGRIAEAVLIAGQPCFLIGDKDGGIQVKDIIELEDQTLKPLTREMYISKPYEFNSKEELDAYIEAVKGATIDSLYNKVKAICKKYIAAEDVHIVLLSADICYTYFQDKVGLTHYLFFVGNNSSGKSNNLKVIQVLAYRNMKSTDITPANIYRFLGSDEEGQGTICEDEADSIDEDHEKMRIFKEGYTTGSRVMRSDSTNYGVKQQAFYTFGFKAFAAERLPDSVRAKGFNQRCIDIPCYYGIPKYDITEVLNPAGVKDYQDLLDELTEVRNTLLIFRMLQYHKPIEKVGLNIDGRENQLFSPVIRIFKDSKAINELLPVISKYVSQKRENNANGWHAYLYRTIRDTIKAQGKGELQSSLIWEMVTSGLPGAFRTNKAGDKLPSYESEEFGTISQKSVIETYMQVFGAKQSPNRRESRKLLFDLDKLAKVSKQYELEVEVQIVTVVTLVTDMTDVKGVGLSKYLQKPDGDTSEPNPSDASQPSQVSQPSPMEQSN